MTPEQEVKSGRLYDCAVVWSLLVALTVALSAQQAPPREAAPKPGAAGSVVRGRVTSAATGQPLHRVRVTLNAPNPNAPSGVTDTKGIFEILNVPAGSYAVTATRAGYLTIQYGQRRPREAVTVCPCGPAFHSTPPLIQAPRMAIIPGLITPLQ